MKDLYKAENTRIYTNSRQAEVIARLGELGYDTSRLKVEDDFFYTFKDGVSVSHPSYQSSLFLDNLNHKHLTVDELIYPQRGEWVEVSGDGEEWAKKIFFGKIEGFDYSYYTSTNGTDFYNRKFTAWKQMRPIKKETPESFKGFEEAIEHLQEAMKILKPNK